MRAVIASLAIIIVGTMVVVRCENASAEERRPQSSTATSPVVRPALPFADKGVVPVAVSLPRPTGPDRLLPPRQRAIPTQEWTERLRNPAAVDEMPEREKGEDARRSSQRPLQLLKKLKGNAGGKLVPRPPVSAGEGTSLQALPDRRVPETPSEATDRPLEGDAETLPEATREVAESSTATTDALQGDPVAEIGDWRRSLQGVDLKNAFSPIPHRADKDDAGSNSIDSHHPPAWRDPYQGAPTEWRFHWSARNLSHRTLYFEDMPLERYGYTRGECWQPVLSAADFARDLLVAPLRWGKEVPCQLHYVLGLERPGTCAPRERERWCPVW